MWRIVTSETFGETVPDGLRDDRGFVCQFLAPTYWPGQDARYREECEQLRRHAEIMCDALNREVI